MRQLYKISNRVKESGVRGVLGSALRKLTEKTTIIDLGKLFDFVSDYNPDDKFTPTQIENPEKLVMNWFMISMGTSGGGDINIFRFINGFAKLGYKCNVYIVDNKNFKTDEEFTKYVTTHFGEVNANFYLTLDDVQDSDITVATQWKTAYFVHKVKNTKHKFYFVQDYEPKFYPPGSEYFFAEETYKMGFNGITAGYWLQDFLKERYGMNTQGYNFTYNKEKYYLKSEVQRDPYNIFFYARNITPRRCFELGVLAFEQLHKLDNRINVIMAGWDINNVVIHFNNEKLGLVNENELVDIYNKCSMGVVLSATNCSLLPTELMACGCVPVINKGDNNEWNVQDKVNGILVDPIPNNIAKTIKHYIDNQSELSEIRSKGISQIHGESFESEINKINNFILQTIRK